MTPIDWTNAMRADVPWQVCYPEVAKITRAWLKASPIADVDTMSTHELVEALFPEKLAVGEGIYARRRIFRALMALTTRDLKDCCTQGAKQSMFGAGKSGPKVRPWRWHAPLATSTHIVRCPHCGKEL